MSRLAHLALIASLLLAGGCSAEQKGDLLRAVSDVVVRAIVADETKTAPTPAPAQPDVKVVAKPACVAPSCPKVRPLRG